MIKGHFLIGIYIYSYVKVVYKCNKYTASITAAKLEQNKPVERCE